MNNITTLPVDCFTCVNMRNTLRTVHFSRVLTSSLLRPVSGVTAEPTCWWIPKLDS